MAGVYLFIYSVNIYLDGFILGKLVNFGFDCSTGFVAAGFNSETLSYNGMNIRLKRSPPF